MLYSGFLFKNKTKNAKLKKRKFKKIKKTNKKYFLKNKKILKNKVKT